MCPPFLGTQIPHQPRRLLELSEDHLPAGLLEQHKVHINVTPAGGGLPFQLRGKKQELDGLGLDVTPEVALDDEEAFMVLGAAPVHQ